MDARAYHLDWEYTHVNDLGNDAFHVPFQKGEELAYHFVNPVGFKPEVLPEVIYFQADFKIISSIDFPVTDIQIPIMSFKMISTLRQLGSFDHTEVRVIMIDDMYHDERFDSNKNLFPSVPRDDLFRAIRIERFLSCFDFEKSRYKPSRSDPAKPSAIEKLVLKEPAEGFPPLFKVEFLATKLCVSAEAKKALEENGIAGCKFKPIET